MKIKKEILANQKKELLLVGKLKKEKLSLNRLVYLNFDGFKGIVNPRG